MSAASVGLAAAAAGCNAISSVLQRKANRDENPDESFGITFLIRLFQRPAWLFGGLAMIVSFLLQATALALGSLAVVEPVLVAELPLTLVIGSWLLRRRLSGRDAATAVALAGGLAVFLVGLAPSGGSEAAVSRKPVLLALAATVAGVAALTVAGRLAPRRVNSALFGAAAGSGFGLTASLMKVAMAHLTADGVRGLFTAWSLYGMAACGVASVVLVQAALRTGTLVTAQPGITLLDPLVSIVWGTVVLGERVRSGPLLTLAVAGGAVMVAGVFVLTRSPSLAEHSDDESAAVTARKARPAASPRRTG